jgi:hypothetical protein
MIDYMRFDVMHFDEVIASVDLKPENSTLPYVKNFVTGFNKQFSPEMEGFISLEELERWLKWRTFPPSRVNVDELLEVLGLNAYNRWGIVRKTHGIMADDEFWIRFKGENLKHKDVCLRKELYYPDEAI